MKLFLLPLFLILAMTGCPSSTTTGGGSGSAIASPLTPIVNGAISCTKAEAAAVAQGLSVTSVALGVVETLALSQAGGLDINAAINALIARYGGTVKDTAEAVVGCAVNQLAPPVAVAGATGPKLTPPTPQQLAAARVIESHQWKFVK